ncbi:hypothetical protein U1Q18_046242, partial [Sarracenia purpurea var. burkii]
KLGLQDPKPLIRSRAPELHLLLSTGNTNFYLLYKNHGASSFAAPYGHDLPERIRQRLPGEELHRGLDRFS